MSTDIIERQATKQGYDIVQTTKMLGQLGNKLEDGLKIYVCITINTTKPC